MDNKIQNIKLSNILEIINFQKILWILSDIYLILIERK